MTNFKLATLLLMLHFLLSCSSTSTSRTDFPQGKKARLYYQQGTSKLMQKDYTDALNNLLKALKEEPKNSKIHNNLGMAYHFKGATEKALKHLHISLDLDETNEDARNNIASIYTQLKKYELAEKEYNKILENLSYAKQFRTHYNLGVVQYKTKKFKAARKSFLAALKDNEGYCPAHFQIGIIAQEGQQYQKALESFKQASQGVCYMSPAPHYFKGIAYLQLQDYEKAKKTFNFMVKKFKGQPYFKRAQMRLTWLNKHEKDIVANRQSGRSRMKIQAPVKIKGQFQSPNF